MRLEMTEGDKPDVLDKTTERNKVPVGVLSDFFFNVQKKNPNKNVVKCSYWKTRFIFNRGLQIVADLLVRN